MFKGRVLTLLGLMVDDIMAGRDHVVGQAVGMEEGLFCNNSLWGELTQGPERSPLIPFEGTSPVN
jgi:hypothetical protein